MDAPRPIADSIQKYINDAFTTIPDDKRGAIVTYIDLDGSVKGVAALKLNDQWRIAAHIDKPSGEPPSAGAAVQFSWG